MNVVDYPIMDDIAPAKIKVKNAAKNMNPTTCVHLSLFVAPIKSIT